MRTQAKAQFSFEMKLLEGYANYLYFDTVNRATTGIGQMIDAGGHLDDLGLSLPWRDKQGNYARETAIAAEYDRLKALGIDQQGGGAYRSNASLFLDASPIEWMFQTTAAKFEAVVAKALPDWATLRADAQLAVMSMAWNLGGAFLDGWPHLDAGLKAQNYLAASDNCEINARPSLRNRRNQTMFLQSARAELRGDNPDTLFGPVVTLSAVVVANATGANFSSNAWWVQAMLRLVGSYKGPLDGLFGPESQAAWRSYSNGSAITRTALLRLSSGSGLVVGVND